jgi:hypothetical protein
VIELALSGMEMFPFELQFQLVVEVTTVEWVAVPLSQPHLFAWSLPRLEVWRQSRSKNNCRQAHAN